MRTFVVDASILPCREESFAGNQLIDFKNTIIGAAGQVLRTGRIAHNHHIAGIHRIYHEF